MTLARRVVLFVGRDARIATLGSPLPTVWRITMRPTGEVLLLTPGPTPIHPRALAAMQWPMRGHMDPEVFAYNDGIVADLKRLYGAGDDAFASLLSGTGSLGMEAGLANLLEPGDRLLVASNGVFGERTAIMGERLSADVHVVRAEPGL